MKQTLKNVNIKDILINIFFKSIQNSLYRFFAMILLYEPIRSEYRIWTPYPYI